MATPSRGGFHFAHALRSGPGYRSIHHLFASGHECSRGNRNHARVQGAQFWDLPMRRMRWHREIVVVKRQIQHLAQVEFGVIAQAGGCIASRVLALGDPKFPTIEPIGFLCRRRLLWLKRRGQVVLWVWGVADRENGSRRCRPLRVRATNASGAFRVKDAGANRAASGFGR